MILNGPIVVSLFLAVLGLILGLLATVAWLRREGKDGEGAYLVFLLLLTAFGLRILAWPLSYVALQSAVPHVSGAMCIFGVTRLCPLWANLLQAVRPLLICALGGWLALRLTNSGLQRLLPGQQRRRSPTERGLLFAALVLLIIDCLLELVVFASLRPDHPVYCCGSVYDLPGRISSLIPGSLFGAQHAQLLLPLLHVCALLTAAVCLLAGLASWRGWPASGGKGRSARSVATLIPLLLLSMVSLAFIASMEVITPRLTGLPFHHCLYCLIGKTAAGPWIAVSLALGVLAGFWGSLLLPGPPNRRAAVLLLAGGLSIIAFLAVTDSALVEVGGAGDLGFCPACGAQLYDTVHLVEVVSGNETPVLFCSVGCALGFIETEDGREEVSYVTVRDEFTGIRLDSGAAYFVEAGMDTEGRPRGIRWHVYQYLENAHIMAFELGGNVVPDPFGAEVAIRP